MKIVKESKESVLIAAEFLNKGGILVCPTDTVYGLIADVKSSNKIYRLKKRPKSKPLALFVKDLKMAKEIAEIGKEPASANSYGVARQKKILRKYWPGRYTFILKAKNKKQKAKTIALRIPKYKFLNDLLKKVNKPLLQTSANISGEPAITKIKEVVKVFGKKDVLVIDAGNLPKRKPSKIIDLTNDKIKVIR